MNISYISLVLYKLNGILLFKENSGFKKDGSETATEKEVLESDTEINSRSGMSGHVILVYFYL